jgi:hypothetical protein
MLDWKLNNFLYFFDLLFKATDHVISGIWNFFNFHQVNQGINFRWKNFMQQVAVTLKSNSCVRSKFVNINFAVDINNILAFTTNLDKTFLFPIILEILLQFEKLAKEASITLP